MGSIAVTGSSGAVGSRVVERLVEHASGRRIVAIDRADPPRPWVETSTDETSARGLVETHRLDLMTDVLEPALEGCDTIIHLAEDDRRRADREIAGRMADRVLQAADAVGCQHLVLQSSALVYGAHNNNPVPLTEDHPIRLGDGLAHAMIKADLEDRAVRWSERSGATAAILRPTATLSENESSWIGAALRAAAAVRPEQVDPPVQFLHHDDLVDALVLAAGQRLSSTYNVAPDGWIGAETFRALRGEADVRLPLRLSNWRLRAAKALANRALLDDLEPYVRWPWVVANDRLRSYGWTPRYTNEEAYVAGTTSPLLSAISTQRRQEVALGAAGTVGMAAAGAAVWALRRTIR